MRGLVSVIVPTFNRAALLAEALESVRAQSYRPIELVVIDDGSTDGTEEAMRRWLTPADEASGLTCRYERQRNRGAPAARNRGLDLAGGEYIQYLDSDDTLDARKIGLQVTALQRDPHPQVVAGDSFELETGTRAEPLIPLSREEGLLRCITAWTLAVNNPLFRRSACQQLGSWDERMRCFEDASYMAGIFCKGLALGYVAGATSYIRAHHSGSSSTYGARVSFRGEPERARDHVLALYRHHCTVSKDFPADLRGTEPYRTSLVKERFRVARKLLQIGEESRAADLLREHAGQARTARERFDAASLGLLTKVLGTQRGATWHERTHDALHGARAALRR